MHQNVAVAYQKLNFTTDNFSFNFHGNIRCTSGDLEKLAYFYGPVGILLAINLLLFASTARQLTCGLWKREEVKSTTERLVLKYFAFETVSSPQPNCKRKPPVGSAQKPQKAFADAAFGWWCFAWNLIWRLDIARSTLSSGGWYGRIETVCILYAPKCNIRSMVVMVN